MLKTVNVDGIEFEFRLGWHEGDWDASVPAGWDVEEMTAARLVSVEEVVEAGHLDQREAELILASPTRSLLGTLAAARLGELFEVAEEEVSEAMAGNFDDPSDSYEWDPYDD